MNPELATVAAWSYGIAGIGYAAFSVYLWFAWRGGLRGLALVLATGLTAVWGLLAFAFAWSEARAFLALAAVADVLRVGGWYVFLLLLIEQPPRPSLVGYDAGSGETVAPDSAAGVSNGAIAGARPRSVSAFGDLPGGASRRLTWLVPFAGALVALGLLAQVALTLRFSLFGDPGRFAAFDGLAASIFGLVLIEQLFRNVADDARWNIKPLCLGLAGAFIFDLYLHAEALLFSRFDAEAWSVRGFVYALVVPLLAITTARNREWTLRIAMSRRAAFHTTALLMSGLYLLFIAGAGYYVRYFGGTWGGALQIVLLSVGLIILGALAFSGSVRAKLRVLISKHFFSYRYDYRDEWLRFTRALGGQEGPLQLGQQVIRALADLVESPAGGLWLRDASGRGGFVQEARWNMTASTATEEGDSRFCRFLRESGWVVNLEEFRASPERYRDCEIPAWLSQMPNAWLIVPLATVNELFGFVVLTTARTRVEVNWEVNDLLKTAARQAAAFLAQTQAAEALLEARKFEAFNRMSAFVVHDLKNIVAQLSLMLKNSERHHANPAFQQDMLMTVGHSVERMKRLMMQLRDGTTPVEAPHGIDLAGLIDRIRKSKSGQSPSPELVGEERVMALGHDERLERVIGHVVQNAIDATASDGRVWIRLGIEDGQAMVEVGDTGHGMTPEFVRERLFKPFQTTKQGGMGIGAYESFQYVQELGGQVQVDSTPGAGTRVRLLLPLYGATAGGAANAEQKVAAA